MMIVLMTVHHQHLILMTAGLGPEPRNLWLHPGIPQVQLTWLSQLIQVPVQPPLIATEPIWIAASHDLSCSLYLLQPLTLFPWPSPTRSYMRIMQYSRITFWRSAMLILWGLGTQEQPAFNSLLVKQSPKISDWTSRTGMLLFETAKKAFENMRHDFMHESRKIADDIFVQIIEWV